MKQDDLQNTVKRKKNFNLCFDHKKENNIVIFYDLLKRNIRVAVLPKRYPKPFKNVQNYVSVCFTV